MAAWRPARTPTRTSRRFAHPSSATATSSSTPGSGRRRSRARSAKSRACSAPRPRRERALRRAKRALRGRHTAISHRDERRVQDAWVVSESVRSIATAPAVIELLRATYGREPLPFQTLNFRVGSEQRPHSDAMHFNSEPPGFMCGLWIALEDIGPDQGPLVYYPGSHRLAEVTRGDVDAAAGLRARRLRGVRRLADRARGVGAAQRDPAQGRGADLVVEPDPRRRPAARSGPDPLEPGHPLLLRGLSLLEAARIEPERAPVLGPDLGPLTGSDPRPLSRGRRRAGRRAGPRSGGRSPPASCRRRSSRARWRRRRAAPSAAGRSGGRRGPRPRGGRGSRRRRGRGRPRARTRPGRAARRRAVGRRHSGPGRR